MEDSGDLQREKDEENPETKELLKPPLPPPKKKKNKIPVRKRLKHVKRHKNDNKAAAASTSGMVTGDSNSGGHFAADLTSASSSFAGDVENESTNETRLDVVSPSPSLPDHDYCGPVSRPSSGLSYISSTISISDFSEECTFSDSSVGLLSPTPSTTPSPSPCPPTPVMHSSSSQCPTTYEHICDFSSAVHQERSPEALRPLLMDARQKLFFMLPNSFLPVVDHDGMHIVMLGRRESKAVQREIVVACSGSVRFEVHGREHPVESIMSGVREHICFTEGSVNHFVDRVIDIVNNVRLLEICAGMDKLEYKCAWPHSQGGTVDSDVYKECRYRETYRSTSCKLLVNAGKWRCPDCQRLQPLLKRKLESMKEENPNINTNTRYLTEKQKDTRLSTKQKTIRLKNQTIDRLQHKMQEMIMKEGVVIEKNLANDIKEILQDANLSCTQSLFLQQQIKAVGCKKSCGMRWHPTLIRFALSIYLKAPGAYKDLCESGFVKLPSSRTLFDYSHATKIEEGIDKTVIEATAKQADEAAKSQQQKQYHVVMVDEMHISKNIVVLKSSGEVIGFKNLDDIDQELATLESYLDDPDKPLEKELASKVMSFMVKGVSSKLKHVVASYPVCNPSPNQMYVWTWEVIGALERSGVMVIALVCDGCAINRKFIKLHKPVTVVPSGVVFDTRNKFAPGRILYFLSDVPHLLKTIRNAFYNSRKNKKSTRLLKKNGQLIVWETIIRLYLEKKGKILRKSYKLNAQNVFPDSYTRMKVHPAAEVLSHTVGCDITSQGWPGTSETVEFIERVNNWFDLLNGAFSGHGRKTNNRRLEPYTMKDLEEFESNCKDSRFHELLDFLKYLDDWKEEVKNRREASIIASMSLVDDDLGVQPLEEGSFHALDETGETGETEEDFGKNLLTHQTLLGTEMSSRAFIGATTFLLKEGVSFINARVFCQDALEQNFDKQRMSGGGSSNPNYLQYLHRQRAIHQIGTLSATKRTGNTEVLPEDVEVSIEPLPKRRK